MKSWIIMVGLVVGCTSTEIEGEPSSTEVGQAFVDTVAVIVPSAHEDAPEWTGLGDATGYAPAVERPCVPACVDADNRVCVDGECVCMEGQCDDGTGTCSPEWCTD